MRFKESTDDDAEYPRPGMLSEQDIKMAYCTTRQYWAEEEAKEALLDGWKACLKRMLEKEEADINNRSYRRGEAGQ